MTASEATAPVAAPAERSRALLALTATVLIWGFTTVVVRTLAVAIGPSDLLVIRAMISGAIMAVLVTLWRGWHIRRPDLPRFLLVGLLGVTGYNSLSTFGLRTTPASLGGLFLGMEPLFIAVFAAVLLGERIRWMTAIGLALAALGTLFLLPGGRGGAVGIGGPLLVLLSAVVWSLSAVLSKPLLPVYGASRATLLTSIIGFVPLLSLASASTPLAAQSMTPGLWMVMLFLAVVGSLSLQLWSYGLKHIPSASAAAFIYAVPLISVAAGVLLLGEPVTLPLLAGGALIMTGVVVAQLRRR
jgi:drug/metabolite transporter (DMT)-like permease